jgi:hypothetical protein
MTWWMWEGSNKLLLTSESKSKPQLRMRDYEMQSSIMVFSKTLEEGATKKTCV